MAAQNPYVPSSGILVQSFAQFRKMLPTKIDADTLKKLSLAPKNEAAVLNVMRHLGFIDENNQKTQQATKVFAKHDDADFQSELESTVNKSYTDLFETLGPNTWSADRSALIGYFRVHDETSELTATRQAVTFETLAALAGKRDGVAARSQQSTPRSPKRANPSKAAASSASASVNKSDLPAKQTTILDGGVGLTVRVEINLPAQGDQETYDRIFQSIRKNLIDA
jgi:hypothetical protein